MSNFLLLLFQSFFLDLRFIRISKWSFSKKLIFLFIKDCLIIKHFFKTFSLGEDCTFLFGKKVFYNSSFGLADYESILTRHQYLLHVGKINNIKTIIDVGANVGFFSMFCKELYPKSYIYAIEPIPKTYECLKLNLQEHELVRIFNLGFYDNNGKGYMYFDKNNSSVSHLIKDKGIKVHLQKLDNFININKIKKIDLLKIDTELFEAHVLRGANNCLKNTRYLFIEITIKNNSNYTLSSLLSLLYSKDYDFQLLAFRNYTNRGEGEITTMDVLFENIAYKQ